MQTRQATDPSPLAFLQSQVNFWQEEVNRGRAISDTIVASASAYRAQISALTSERDALHDQVKKLQSKLAEAKKREENIQENIEENLENHDAPFLGCHDCTETKFVERLQDFIALLCYKKAQKTNWSAADLMHRISASTLLAKKRATNGRNAWIEFQSYMHNRGVEGAVVTFEGMGQIPRIPDPNLVAGLDVLIAPDKEEGYEVRIDRFEDAWRIKTPVEKDTWKTLWVKELEPRIGQKKREGLTWAQKAQHVKKVYQAIANTVLDTDTPTCLQMDSLGYYGMQGSVILVPDYLSRGQVPYFFSTCPPLAAFLQQKIVRRKKSDLQDLIEEIHDGFKLHAAVDHGREELLKEGERRAKKQKAGDVLQDCAQTIEAAMDTTSSLGFWPSGGLITVAAGVPEEQFSGSTFDWEGIYATCAKYKIAYRPMPVEFRWRSFRGRTGGIFRDNKKAFLPGGDFAIYPLIAGEVERDGEGVEVHHDDLLRRLKACASAQSIWRKAGGRSESECWILWDISVAP
ncbi:hypothetical protein QFC21_001548 [Naganishia friedmannii]|uniref:Uncharacterized protein n=1 Tax=Naganishia friedmannii TaxID=89922 RepID=A0ACC2W449_9TREE|nr:hypothetical protein QFC21_001548 [Naganishia friedmannii]